MASFRNPILQNIESTQIIEVNKSPFSLGRGLESDYVIGNNVVSRLHCKLEKTNDGWVLRDTSTNGTMVNDGLYKGVVSSVLKHNDYICLGVHSCTYKFLLETEKVPNMQLNRIKEETPVRSPGSEKSFDDNGVSDDLLNGVIDNILSHPEPSPNIWSNDQQPSDLPQTSHQSNSEYGNVLAPTESISLPVMPLEQHSNNLPVNYSPQKYNVITSMHNYARFPADRVLEPVHLLTFQPYMGTYTSCPYNGPNYEHDNSKNNNTEKQQLATLANQAVQNFDFLLSRNNIKETNELNSNKHVSRSSTGELPGTSGMNVYNHLPLPSGVPMPSTSYTSSTVMNEQSNNANTKQSDTSVSLETHASKKMKLDKVTSVQLNSPVRSNNLALVNSTTGIQDEIVDLTNSDDLSDDESPKAASRPAVIVEPSSSATENNESIREVDNNATNLKCVRTPDCSKTIDTIENTRQQDYERMESELMCTICSNLFIKAVTLECSHTFCEYCINFWRKKKSNCPICRAVTKSTIRTLVLDNVIEKMMENAPSEEIKQRKDAIAEREQIEAAEKSKPKRRNVSRRGNGRYPRPARIVAPPPPPPPPQSNPLQFGVISIDETPDLSEDGDDVMDLIDYYQDDWYHRQVFGGYGRCFSCGDPGHWANRCPYRGNQS